MKKKKLDPHMKRASFSFKELFTEKKKRLRFQISKLSTFPAPEFFDKIPANLKTGETVQVTQGRRLGSLLFLRCLNDVEPLGLLMW